MNNYIKKLNKKEYLVFLSELHKMFRTVSNGQETGIFHMYKLWVEFGEYKVMMNKKLLKNTNWLKERKPVLIHNVLRW